MKREHYADTKEVKASHIPENWTPVTFERKRDCEKFTVTRQIGCGKIGAYYVVRNPTAFKDGWKVCNTIEEVRKALNS